MLIEWNRKTIGWLLAASSYTGYDRKLAAFLSDYIIGDTLCDIGCGMALCDFELAPKKKHITCVDISPDAISFVSDRIEEAGFSNMDAVCCDGSELCGEWDTVMALFHGQADRIAETYLKLAKHRLILVVQASQFGNTGPEKYRLKKNLNSKTVEESLALFGLRYQTVFGDIEFGQPLRDLDDAVDYVKTYSCGVPEDELTAHIKEKTVPTGLPEHPLYYPKIRHFCAFIIDK